MNILNSISKSSLAFSFAVAFLVAGNLVVTAQDRLTLAQVTTAISGIKSKKATPAVVVAYVRKTGIDFLVSAEIEASLRNSGATNLLIQALKKSVPDAAFFLSRGIERHNKSDYSGARGDYSFAIQLDPKLVEALERRGRVFRDMGEIERAISDFDSIIALSPKEAMAYCLRGDLARISQKVSYESGLRDMNRCVELAKRGWAYKYRGELYDSVEKYDLAIADLTRAVEIDPDGGGVYWGWAAARARIYLNAGKYDLAIRDYTNSLNQGILIGLDQFLYPLRVGRGEAYFARKDYDDAIDDLSVAIDMKPKDSGRPYFYRGRAYLSGSRFKEAAADLQRSIDLKASTEVYLNGVIKEHPNDSAAYALQAADLGDTESAIEKYSFAISVNPDFFWFYDKRADVYKAQGKIDLEASDRQKARDLRNR